RQRRHLPARTRWLREVLRARDGPRRRVPRGPPGGHHPALLGVVPAPRRPLRRSRTTSVELGGRGARRTVTQVTSTPTQPSSGAPAQPEGRRLLRLEVRNAETPIERKPE